MKNKNIVLQRENYRMLLNNLRNKLMYPIHY